MLNEWTGITGVVKKAAVTGRAVGQGILDHAPLFVDSLGRSIGESGENPLCNAKYGRWVPGGDALLALEDIADEFISGCYDYETAVRLAEAITDAVGKPAASKRDLLTVLMRKRGHLEGQD